MSNRPILDMKNFKVDIDDVRIFTGEYDGIQRYDRYKYPVAKVLYDAMEKATWFSGEVSFEKDKVSITKMIQHHQDKYKKTLIFQTTADSLANRFLDNVLSRFCTSPEWEAVFKMQAFQELNHSRAYSHNIREVFPDAEAFFNEGLQDTFIIERLDSEIASYEKLAELEEIRTDEDKMILLDAIYRQYALECVRFQVSFLVGFLIDDLNDHAIQGTVNNNKLILNDEFSHTVIFANLIRILRRHEKEGFSHLMDKVDVEQIFKDVIASEVEWYKYLTLDGEIQGASVENVEIFLNNLGSDALNKIKVNHTIPSTEVHGLTKFFKEVSVINDGKSLGQETTVLAYNVGALKQSAIDIKKIYDDMDSLLNNIKG